MVRKAPATKKSPAAAPAKAESAKIETPKAVEAAPEAVEQPNLFAEFSDSLKAAQLAVTSLKAKFTALEREYNKRLKAAQRDSQKRKRKSGNRSPSGFVKPTLISNELASFLKKPAGTEMARTEVTREINSYIRNHNLQDKANGRKINPDSALSKLLKLKKSDELTYFNLQRYMSPHFQSQKAAAAK